MLVKAQLEDIAGSDSVADDPGTLERHSRDYSMDAAGRPDYVVRVTEAQQIQDVVRLANEHQVPVVPSSSAVHFYGAALPRRGGIVLDLTAMNRILEIDPVNRKARIEPGVTWDQLQTQLASQGHMAMIPLLPHPLRSVLTDYLEREVPVVSRYEYAEPLMGMEVVWPNGDLFRTGSASAPNFPHCFAEGVNPLGPGTIDFFRFLQGAQGTMGIVTWANIKIEHVPRADKVYFVPFKSLSEAVGPLSQIQRRKVGHECLLLNACNLALSLGGSGSRGLAELQRELSPWTIIVILSGPARRPQEKIRYEEEALFEIATEFPNAELLSSLPTLPGVEESLPGMLRRPSPQNACFWKHRSKGGCRALFFIARPTAAPGLIEAAIEVASGHGCSGAEIGAYVQPIEDGRACHCELDFYYVPDIPEEVERVRNLSLEAARILLGRDALFTRPYGQIASLVYQRAVDYASVLREIKGIFDPNNIMNPGNLCF